MRCYFISVIAQTLPQNFIPSENILTLTHWLKGHQLSLKFADKVL